MKNPSIGKRHGLLSRTSRVDGSVHLNAGLRDAYDARKRSMQARKRMEDSRRILQKWMKP
jgi:hypothetical protein